MGVHTIIYGVGSVAQTLGAFLLIPLLTSFLNPEQYGAFSLIQMVGTIAAAIFYLGVTSALPRSYFDHNEPDRKKQIFSATLLVLLLGALCQISLGHFFSPAISQWFFEGPIYSREIFWSLAASALVFLNQGFYSLLRLERKSSHFVLFSFINLALLFPVVYYLLKFQQMGLLAPFAGIFIVQGLQLVFFFALYCRNHLTLKLKAEDVKVLIEFGTPIILANFAMMSVDWFDRIILEKYHTLADVGVYSLGYRLGSMINALFVTPFTQIWNPMMMEYRTHENFKMFSSKILSYYLLIGLAICFGGLSFSRDLFPLFARSSGYGEAEPVAWVILYSYFFYGLCNIVVAGLFFARKTMKLALITYVAAILNILLNLLWIPQYGTWGATTSTAISYAIIPLMIYFFGSKYFRFEFELNKIFKIFAINSLFVAVLLGPFSESSLLFRIALFLIYTAAIYRFALDKGERTTLKRLGRDLSS